MVSLNAEGGFGHFCVRNSTPRYALQHHVFVNGDAIEYDFAEYRRLDFSPLGVKLGRLKLNLQVLPQTRRHTGIDPRGMAFVVGFGGFDPAGINGAIVLVFGMAGTPGVEELHFIAAL